MVQNNYKMILTWGFISYIILFLINFDGWNFLIWGLHELCYIFCKLLRAFDLSVSFLLVAKLRHLLSKKKPQYPKFQYPRVSLDFFPCEDRECEIKCEESATCFSCHAMNFFSIQKHFACFLHRTSEYRKLEI